MVWRIDGQINLPTYKDMDRTICPACGKDHVRPHIFDDRALVCVTCGQEIPRYQKIVVDK